jgi:dTDP-4-dehydrorhamnose reductase
VKVLITGAAGLVGNHLAQGLERQHDVLALKHGDLDISDQSAVQQCVADAKPELIFNCAVTQVDESEQDLAKAQAVNAKGPRYLAEAANRVGAEIVQFSTQYLSKASPSGGRPTRLRTSPRP